MHKWLQENETQIKLEAHHRQQDSPLLCEWQKAKQRQNVNATK